MKKIRSKSSDQLAGALSAVALAALLTLATSTVASADEADAKRLLQNMSDYVATQVAFSFDYDSILGIVTDDGQNLQLASSGELKMQRPDKVHASRKGGFVDVETFFDGKTLTIFGKTMNVYAELEVPGSVDNLVDVLITKYNLPLPAGDLLETDSYDRLMENVTNIKDLGSGIIDGVECDYLAFRTEEVDWQIWIAQGKKPYPCRFVITAKQTVGQPEYSIQLSNWKTHKLLPETGFRFKNSTKATQVDLQDLQNMTLPKNFKKGDEK